MEDVTILSDEEGDDEEHEGHLTKLRKEAGIVQLPKELRNLLAGGVAGMAAKSVVAPLDRIKILFQVTSAKFSLGQIPAVARNIVRNEGFSALWKGNTATMIRVVPYSGIQFMVFDRCKQYYLHQHKKMGIDEITNPSTGSGRKYGLSAQESLISGMVAGTVSASVTYPLDLARAQLAVLLKHREGHGHSRTLREVLMDNYSRRGIPGLYRGISITLLGILPYSGIAFALNEQGKREVRS